MPRQLRIEYPGAIYHVMNRGDRREPIYLDDAVSGHIITGSQRDQVADFQIGIERMIRESRFPRLRSWC